MRDRSMALIVKGNKILMEKLFCYERYFYSLPGGGIESGEAPEEAAIRELKEECCIDGKVVRKLTEIYQPDGRTEYVFEVEISDDQIPALGYDPEAPEDAQILKEVCWMSLDELSEKDRAFLWAYGLMGIKGFFEEVVRWGDEISYPVRGAAPKYDA